MPQQTRRSALIALATPAIAEVQTAGPTNSPRCPVCRGSSDDAGYLAVSTERDTYNPASYPGAKVNVCQSCGLLFCTAANLSG